MFGEASKHEFQPNFSFSAFEIGHLFSRNINYNINSLLWLRVGARLRCRRGFHSGSRNENNNRDHLLFLGAATGKFISFQLPVCYARPIYIYIICVPTRNRNNEFIL